MIRLATTDDLEFLVLHDEHVPRELMLQKINDAQVYVAAEGNDLIGWLRWGLFWDLVPFMNMLYLLESHRRKGIGRQLVERWEQDMQTRGYTMLLTSTQSNEEGQFFYRKLGYIDTGALLLPDEPAEILLRKDVGNDTTRCGSEIFRPAS